MYIRPHLGHCKFIILHKDQTSIFNLQLRIKYIERIQY